MPGFVFQPLLWGLLLVGVPVLIHLINMLRHRRVPWAAMEFLLQSQKRNRTWVALKQLLLLLMRMAAVAAIVLVLAQPLLRNELGRLFGGAKTHHIVLLDDSFSMSDRWADTSAFEQAKAVVRRVGAQAAAQQQPQTFTLVRFSRVGREHRGSDVDMLQVAVDRGFEAKLEALLDRLDPSELAAGPVPALAEAQRLLDGGDEQRRIVYLVSDFRAREWNEPTELRARMLAMTAEETVLHLIHCVDRQRDNLAIVSLDAAPGTRAVGVPVFAEVTVH
ncbi:MAG: BatA domain-containing protein, partial [Patescibacteria group bacterium]|nr:BatA domain-containing protein [Patescibacteria group bacterium]